MSSLAAVSVALCTASTPVSVVQNRYRGSTIADVIGATVALRRTVTVAVTIVAARIHRGRCLLCGGLRGLQVQMLQLGVVMIVVVGGYEAGRGRRLEQTRIEAQHVEVGSRRRFGQQEGMVRRCN